MKEIECRKGLTLVELMIVIAILGIFAALFIPRFLSKADGMEIMKLMPADDATIQEVAKAIHSDVDQTAVVMIYSADWSADRAGYDRIDDLMEKLGEIAAKFEILGIPKSRLTLLLANKGGLEHDGTPVPEADGIYLYLE